MSEHRQCIKCGQTMRKRVMHEVEIDCCPDCGGLWLDRGEIRQLTERVEPRSLSAISVEAADPADEAISPKRASSPVEQPCPACGGKLSEAAFETFAVEHCIACEGIYLDPGELQKAMVAVDTRGDWAATVVSLAESVATRGTIG